MLYMFYLSLHSLLGAEHWEAVLHVVRYLKGNPGQSILLRTDCDLHLRAFCDSD